MNPITKRLHADFDRVMQDEAVNGICCEPGDCFVCEEDREPPVKVSLSDDIPDYFAGIPSPNPIQQSDED